MKIVRGIHFYQISDVSHKIKSRLTNQNHFFPRNRGDYCLAVSLLQDQDEDQKWETEKSPDQNNKDIHWLMAFCGSLRGMC